MYYFIRTDLLSLCVREIMWDFKKSWNIDLHVQAVQAVQACSAGTVAFAAFRFSQA